MNDTLPKPKIELKSKDEKKYEVKTIINNVVYGKDANNQIPKLYYLVLWKSYLEEEST